MTKEEFKKNWEEGNISTKDILQCAKDWRIYDYQKDYNIAAVTEQVLISAKCK